MKEVISKALSSAKETAPNQAKSLDSPGKSSEIWRDDISSIPGDIFINRRPLPVFKDGDGIVPGPRPGTTFEDVKPSESGHWGEPRWGISGIIPGESIESSRPLPVFRDGVENRGLTASLDSAENISGLSKETLKNTPAQNEVNEPQKKDSSEQVDAAAEQKAAQPKPEPVSRTESSPENVDNANETASKMEQQNPSSSTEQVDDKIKYDIHTRNESLEGDSHPVTGVPFERKTVTDSEGNEVTGVFPVFDSKYDATLPEEKLQASDAEQFSECNNQLKDAIKKDPELAKQFSKEQLEQIENGDTPDGYVWHHNEEKGKMQLVDSDVHAKTGHTGGKCIWGGGTENR